MAAIPNFTGFLNACIAPPFRLNTMPVRNMTNRLPRASTCPMLSSHKRVVSPKKDLSGGSLSIKGSAEGMDLSGPYHPIAEALITALTALGISAKDFTTRLQLFVRLETISFFLLSDQRLSAIPAPA